MNGEPSPNAKFDHAYAIVRLDLTAGRDRPVDEHTATIKKVVWEMETARSEVERLNRLAEGKRYRYHWEVARMERRPSMKGGVASDRRENGDAVQNDPDRTADGQNQAGHGSEHPSAEVVAFT